MSSLGGVGLSSAEAVKLASEGGGWAAWLWRVGPG